MYYNTLPKATLDAILNNILDGIITISQEGKILSFNYSAECILGYQEKEIIGTSFRSLLDDLSQEYYDDYLDIYITAADPEEEGNLGIRSELVVQTRDDVLVPVRLVISKAFIDSKPICIVVLSDISEKRKAEHEAKRLHALTELTRQIVIAANETSTIEETVVLAIHKICEFTSWNLGHSYIYDKEANLLASLNTWYQKDKKDDTAALIAVSNSNILSTEKNWTWEVCSTVKPLWIEDVSTSPLFPHLSLIHI